MKLMVGDKVTVYLPKDRYTGWNGVVTEVLDVGIVVQFDGGERQIYNKRGEVKQVKGEKHEASQH
jgi:hypothetical protein